MTVTFTVSGDPQGKARPRFTKNGRAYTPKKTSDYEKKIAVCYKIQSGVFFERAVRVCITAFFKIPKSYSKKMRAEIADGRLKPVKKPDSDNIIKAVLDALNGVAYKDDTQVTSVTLDKLYAYGDRRTECLIVTIEEDI